MSTHATKDNPVTASDFKNSEPSPDITTTNPLLIKAKLSHTPLAEKTAKIEANQNVPKMAQDDFSVDYDIPTLDDIALPGEMIPPISTRTPTTLRSPLGGTVGTPPGSATNIPGAIPIPKHILNTGLNTVLDKSDQSFSPEFIDKLAADLQEILIPEIEKSINFAFNNALASAMDQANRITKSTINKRIRDLIPELLKEHLQNISKNDLK